MEASSWPHLLPSRQQPIHPRSFLSFFPSMQSITWNICLTILPAPCPPVIPSPGVSKVWFLDHQHLRDLWICCKCKHIVPWIKISGDGPQETVLTSCSRAWKSWEPLTSFSIIATPKISLNHKCDYAPPLLKSLQRVPATHQMMSKAVLHLQVFHTLASTDSKIPPLWFPNQMLCLLYSKHCWPTIHPSTNTTPTSLACSYSSFMAHLLVFSDH